MKRMNVSEDQEQIAEIIRNGGVVVFPTDTVYGFICSALNEKAIERIFKIKKRDFKKPIPVFVKDIEMAKEIAVVDKKQEEFLRKVWPGNVTVVLKSKGNLPEMVLEKDKTIGLRIPDYKPLNNLLNALNIPLGQTSVNLAGEAPLNNASDIMKEFVDQESQPDLIVDGGELISAEPSTIVGINDELTIFRQGAVSREELEDLLNYKL